LRAHIHQPGKAARARHGQIEKDKINFAAALEQLDKFIEGAGLGDIGSIEKASDGLAQGATKKRMIVSDHQPILYGLAQSEWSFGLTSATGNPVWNRHHRGMQPK